MSTIYLNKNAENSYPAMQAAKRHNIIPVDSVAEVPDNKTSIYIADEQNTFVHRCPATKIYRCCNYYVADISEGCPFDCTYCILQAYLNHEYIKVYSGFDIVKREIADLPKDRFFRLGTGELTDSLALDHIFNFSGYIAEIINKSDNILFEFKTKSANIVNLINCNPKNLMVSWSLNPPEIMASEEFLTAKIEDRLAAAKECAQAGFGIGFHFDPLIWHAGFEENYAKVIKMMADAVPETSVKYISVSTFRFIPELLDTVRRKFDSSHLLESEYVRSLDGKMRYFKPQRAYMLDFFVKEVRKYWKNAFIYFCMEHESLWKRILGYDPGEREDFEKYFPCGKK